MPEGLDRQFPAKPATASSGVAFASPLSGFGKNEIEMMDGTTIEMTANKIAENLYAQVDDAGNRHGLVDEIIDHRKRDDAISTENAWITSKNGNRSLKKTTRGWQILVQWKDGSTNWVESKDAKESFPLEVTADCREKTYTVAGPEFGLEEGTVMFVRKALYGLKSSGAAFQALLAETLHDCGFTPTTGDPDIHIQPAVKENGDTYYEMILTYVDDIICVSHQATAKTMEEAVVQKNFKIKKVLIQPPDMYLGAQLSERELTGQRCWTMTSKKYVNVAIQRVTDNLKKRGDTVPNKCVTPMRSGYRPEIDESEELDAAEPRTYQDENIGILQWAVELGRTDIMVEVSMLSAHLANPSKGHIEQVIHVFGYLKLYPKRTLAFDPRHHKITESRFTKHDWTEFYRDAGEEMPPRIPPPRGKEVTSALFR